jgi:methylthioribose-1-phosphate isomerase
VEWVDGQLALIDQTRIPLALEYVRLSMPEEVEAAIRTMVVRGAPAIGAAAAYGVALALQRWNGRDAFERDVQRLRNARPTAVNLRWAVDRAASAAAPWLDREDPAGALEAVLREAHAIAREDEEANRSIARHGLHLVPEDSTILTHCNTGTLATGGAGTALGMVRAAHAAGRLVRCYVTETRPLLQGARLTAWELQRSGIPVVLLPDTAAAALILSGKVAAVITGADRIAANGDTANKVGTLGLALAAARAGVPFYIAAPTSTFDPACASGEEIPIEFRAADEVGGFGGVRWAPAGIEAWNPAFDVTPADLIAGIITERGTARPPYRAALAALLEHDEREAARR